MVSKDSLLRRMRLWAKSFKGSWSIYCTNKLALIGLGILLVFTALALFPQYFSPYDITKRGTLEDRMKPPSLKHLLGTDDMGKDILSLIIHGTRISMLIGFVSAVISVGIGSIVGLVSGYYGGMKGGLMMRATDVFSVMPTIPLMITLAALLRPSIWNIILVIGVTSWTGVARIVRSEVLSRKERLFVQRARSLGCSDRRILGKYILQGILPLILANTILRVVSGITSEALLGFLGLGDPTVVSWGTLLHFSFLTGAFSMGAYWYFIPPGIAIVLSILGFIMVSQGLDAIINPRLRRI